MCLAVQFPHGLGEKSDRRVGQFMEKRAVILFRQMRREIWTASLRCPTMADTMPEKIAHALVGSASPTRLLRIAVGRQPGEMRQSDPACRQFLRFAPQSPFGTRH